MRFRLLLILLCCLPGPFAARAAPRDQYYSREPHARIEVSDKQTQEPLIGAVVTIVSGADTLRGSTMKTSGYFGLRAQYACDRIFRDSVSLEVSCLGYKTFGKRYAGAEFARRISVEMAVDERSIAQVMVVGKRIAMVFRGDTTVYNASAFKTMTDDRLSELLKQLPGVEIRDNKIYADGEEVKRVYVDGRNLFGKQPTASLTDLKADDVRNVRVYEEQSPEAKYTDDDTARKEKVMDVETKSRRGILWGGEIAAMGGESLEKDYSGQHEIRHAEALKLFRHSEKGSLRLEASNAKDDTQRDNASLGSKITPTKQSRAEFSHEFRRGDSISVWTYADFNRNRRSSISRIARSYFPNDDYARRNEESLRESLSKDFSARIGNTTAIQHRKSSLFTDLGFNYRKGSAAGSSSTRQTLDGDQTRTLLNSDGDDRDIGINATVNYSMRLSEKSRLNLGVSFEYSTQKSDNWQVDTLSSTPGLRTILHSGGDGRNRQLSANVGYQYKTGEKSSLNLGYMFSYRYSRSKRLAIDYLDDPHGGLDSVNSYDYTVDYYTHGLTLSWTHASDNFRCYGHVWANLYDLARDERFPEQEHAPRQFFNLAPNISLLFGKTKRRLQFSLGAMPEVPSAEALRNTLDASNPLLLQAGNPDLKLPTNLSGSLRLNLNDAKSARSFSIGVTGGYGFNYIASQRTFFSEETYLPQYDYTAQKGAQLSTQVNVRGNYNIGSDVTFSQQLSSLQSTFRARLGYDFRQTPYFLGETLCESERHSLRINFGFDTGFSTKFKLSLGTTTAMSSYTTQQEKRQDLRETVNARADLRFGKYFGYAGTLYEFYCNSDSKAQTRHSVILNAAAGRKFGEKNRFSVSVGAVDVFNRPDYASTNFNTDYILTVTTSFLGRYAYLQASYTF